MPFSTVKSADLTKAELFDLVVRTAPDGIVTASATGEITSFSPAAERLFGYEEHEVIGANLSVLMTAAHGARHDGYMRRYLETGEARIIGVGREVPARRKTGEVFPVDLAVGELRTADAHIFTGFVRDATARAEAVSRARRLRNELDKFARVQIIGEMATALAHELNQPLAAMTNFARAAVLALDGDGDGVGDAPKVRDYVERVSAQAQRAGEIVRRMRKLVDRGAVDLKPDDVNDVVREAVRAAETNVGPTPVAVRLDLAEELPKALVDRVQIQQVLVNLLANAQDALANHEAAPSIATGLAHDVGMIEMRARALEDDRIMVTVSDTGPGVPKDMLTRMFEPLVSSKPDGAGVGLAICRSIVHAHGGRIWAENNDHGGADIHFTLRAAVAE